MFELRLSDLSESKRKEMLDIFIKRKELRERMGGCPADEDRVKGYTECFHCDECWIAAIENSFKQDCLKKEANSQEAKLELHYYEVSNKIIKLISNHLEISKDKISLESRFESLGADSLDIVEIIMEIENEFKVRIKDKELDKTIIDTVSDLVRIINNYV